MLDFNLDFYIQAGSHVNIIFHSRTEVEMIRGVSFVGLESPVWHASYVFMLLPPNVNKSFSDDIVWPVCRPPTGRCSYRRSLHLGGAWLARVSARRRGTSGDSGCPHLCECTVRPTKHFKWDKKMSGSTISGCEKCLKTLIGHTAWHENWKRWRRDTFKKISRIKGRLKYYLLCKLQCGPNKVYFNYGDTTVCLTDADTFPGIKTVCVFCCVLIHVWLFRLTRALLEQHAR